MKKEIHVSQSGDGWKVEDTDGVLVNRRTKERAKEYAFVMKHLYGYRVFIHHEDGRVEDDNDSL